MTTTKHESTPSALSAAIEGIIRRSDEITAACEGERGELAALFTPKEISRSIDICKALITAVARTRNASELARDAALIGRLRERTMTANNLLAARTTGNPHLITAAIFCEEMLFGLMLDGNPALLTMAKMARVGSLAVSASLRAAFNQMRDLIIDGDREKTLKVEIVKSPARPNGGKAHGDWREDDPAIIQRRDDTKRVLAEIRKRHKDGKSYNGIIKDMLHDPVWGARMTHMSAKSWRSKASTHR